ncbi:SET domain-containing protein SmydA-8-like [Teleopsis dalmanni]|uniref:SET domain-containing protein SmydA-8-like n=1 Tax=Teleopsis dalmanni TaxID=139649 RepID=UPI0018CE8A01|nr:SET domain-containing protein SmydA-8-like [Teleopsis dalmanni]
MPNPAAFTPLITDAQLSSVTSTPELARLLDLHLGKYRQSDPAWEVAESVISGRGIFARRDIAACEELFREHTLLVGPTAHKNTKLNTCVICYCLIEGPEVLCSAGCSLPVCRICSQSEQHEKECKLFRKWIPKDLTQINPCSLRILSTIRCFFLDEDQRKLLYAMQANADKYYLREVANASACFKYFPKDPEMLDYFHRTICAFNTNAFEGRSKVNGHEIMVRALFPLAGLLNHECTPNASHHFENAETIVVTSTRAIAKGEEITTSYTKVLWSNLARKLFLGLTKHFTCHCRRCQDPTYCEVCAATEFQFVNRARHKI